MVLTYRSRFLNKHKAEGRPLEKKRTSENVGRDKRQWEGEIKPPIDVYTVLMKLSL